MKKTIKLAVVAALALGATSVFATNGSNLYGIGAKSRAMGGTSIGISHGAESGLSNPAMISTVKGTEVSFGGIVFMPDVTNTSNLGGGAETASSAADFSVIPSVSIATKVNDNFHVGIGMWGTAGMGVDYRDAVTKNDITAGTQFNMVTNLQLLQFGVPMAYSTAGLSIGITPVVQYGSLDINYDTNTTNHVGAGVGQDLGYGFNLSAAYNMGGLTVGLIYKSQIDMDYGNVLPDTVGFFTGGAGYTNKELSTPEEMGIGFSYATDGHTIAIDYKNIKWSDAKGYADFEWKDQDVFAIGYSYDAKKWTARLGFNYSKSPIEEQTFAGANSSNLSSGVVDTFNLLGFPGIVETTYTLGGSYNLSEMTSIDLAYALSPEVTNSYSADLGMGGGPQTITTKHSQSAVSFAVNFKL